MYYGWVVMARCKVYMAELKVRVFGFSLA
jgi:hypothetical protein